MIQKKAVVTGGTRGIGFAIAKKLKSKGIDVLITGTRHGFDVPAEFEYYAVDFSITTQLQEFAEFLQSYSPNILINNAGINRIASFTQSSDEDFQAIQNINTFAPYSLIKAVLPAMQKQRWGRIINVTSIWSLLSKAGRAAYSVSKFGLDGMTAALSAEVAQYGILVNSVSPGFIETDLTRTTLGEEGIKKIIDTVPVKRLGQPHEIANFIAWLVSEENTFISGQNLVIDGGFSRV